MSYVFISHASEDAEVANRIVVHLEKSGIACWIGPRDVPAGALYNETIVDAIDQCALFLLVFSSEANSSSYVNAEVQEAFEKEKSIAWLRLDDTALRKSLRLPLRGRHFLKLSNAGLEQLLPNLVASIRVQVPGLAVEPAPPKAKTDPPPQPLLEDAKAPSPVAEPASKVKSATKPKKTEPPSERPTASRTSEDDPLKILKKYTSPWRSVWTIIWGVIGLIIVISGIVKGIGGNDGKELTLPEPTLPYLDQNGARFIQVPAGEFSMGSEEGGDDERPVHSVRITQPFYLGQTEVTIGQFRRFLEDAQYMYDPESCWDGLTDNHPVPCISWDDASAYAEWIGGRLPTEAEWEFAARAGSSTAFYWGSDSSQLVDYAWCDRLNTSYPVGGKQPNAYGLYDMLGNLWEWTEDRYDGRTYDREGVTPDGGGYYADPTGPEAGAFRALRGGSFGNDDLRCRCAARGYNFPNFRDDYFGFRIVLLPSSRD